LISALPAALMFAVAGGAWLASRLAPAVTSSRARQIFWPVILASLALTTSIWPLEKKGCSGFAPLAEALLSEAAPAEVTLISSDATGEGMFIAEVAMREPRPTHLIERASKALASSTWSGGNYATAFETDDEVYQFLISGKYRFLVVDDAVPHEKRRQNHDQIRRAIYDHPNAFWELESSEILRGGVAQYAPAKLYKIRHEK
jgi:hypothetical protein